MRKAVRRFPFPPIQGVCRYRASTTSFLAQAWTCPQWGQTTGGNLSVVSLQSASLTTCPVGDNLAVDGHLTRIRLIVWSDGALSDRARMILCIKAGKRFVPSLRRKVTSAI